MQRLFDFPTSNTSRLASGSPDRLRKSECADGVSAARSALKRRPSSFLLPLLIQAAILVRAAAPRVRPQTRSARRRLGRGFLLDCLGLLGQSLLRQRLHRLLRLHGAWMSSMSKVKLVVANGRTGVDSAQRTHGRRQRTSIATAQATSDGTTQRVRAVSCRCRQAHSPLPPP